MAVNLKQFCTESSFSRLTQTCLYRCMKNNNCVSKGRLFTMFVIQRGTSARQNTRFNAPNFVMMPRVFNVGPVRLGSVESSEHDAEFVTQEYPISSQSVYDFGKLSGLHVIPYGLHDMVSMLSLGCIFGRSLPWRYIRVKLALHQHVQQILQIVLGYKLFNFYCPSNIQLTKKKTPVYAKVHSVFRTNN